MMAASKTTVWTAPDRGDPRMNRAVQFKLEDPMLPLSEALRLGGFCYPPSASGLTVDAEGVTLSQRKNQLNRRVRRANKGAGKHPADQMACSEANEGPRKRQKKSPPGTRESGVAAIQGHMYKKNSLPDIPVQPVREESALVTALRNMPADTAKLISCKEQAALGPATRALKSTNMENDLLDMLFSQRNPMNFSCRQKDIAAGSKPISSPTPDQRREDSFLDAILQLPGIQQDQRDDIQASEAETLDAPLDVNLPSTPSSADSADSCRLVNGLGTFERELRACVQSQAHQKRQQLSLTWSAEWLLKL